MRNSILAGQLFWRATIMIIFHFQRRCCSFYIDKLN